MNRTRGIAVNSHELTQRVARGDVLLQDTLFKPETIKRGLDILAGLGGGDIAYTPDMVHEFERILERRFATDDGGNYFQLPNYAPYEDDNLARFYGVKTDQLNFPLHKESQASRTDRLLQEAARETADQIPGLIQQMNWYEKEDWARYGISDEVPLIQLDSDTTQFRNPNHQWSTMDRPISVNDRGNVIQFYDGPGETPVAGGVGENIFPTPHDAWLVDTTPPYPSNR
jgi:hypothetical protein